MWIKGAMFESDLSNRSRSSLKLSFSPAIIKQPHNMDADTFSRNGKFLIDYVADYLEHVGKRRVTPDIKPGSLAMMLPAQAPFKGVDFSSVMKDINDKILPGVVHWQSPFFHAYYPSITSYPAILAEVLVSALNCVGFTWASSPACTDLELIVLDWLAKMLDLPSVFLAKDEKGNDQLGGSIIQCTACDSDLVAVLSARTDMIERLTKMHPELDEFFFMPKFVAYQSDQTHSGFVKACKIAMVRCKTIATGPDNRLHGEDLRRAVEEDKQKGLIPLVFCASLGTTSTCAFDNLMELGPVCNENGIWCHVDAAYAGTAFICPEHRHLMNGVEYADSFNFNCHKWMLTGLDASPMWFKDKTKVLKTFSQDFVMYDRPMSGAATDFKDMQIPLSRRFRALRLWIVISCYGVEGIQELVRRHCSLAKYFASLVRADNRFEMLDCSLGLVTFRLKGSNELNDTLNTEINSDGRIRITPTFIKGQRILRFVVCAERTTEETVNISWNVIREHANNVLNRNS